MTETIASAAAGAAIARRDDPRALVRSMSDEFTAVLPSHIKAASWIRQAAGALRRGKMDPDHPGQFLLEVAARNNPQAFINALRSAAGQGLMPGTDEYYLTPRKVKGRWEILGITGYQGYIELMYRAGAVSTVIAELVHENDIFTYRVGRDAHPTHEIDWRSPDRGPAWLVYAYAIMKDGATSRVVVMNEHDIERIKKKSASAKYDDSPWQTDTDAMWLKSSVRQLRKWVPTSAEFITTQLRAARAADDPHPVTNLPNPMLHEVDTDGDVVDGDDIVDAEMVDVTHVEEVPVDAPPVLSDAQLRTIHTLFSKLGLRDTPEDHAEKLLIIGDAVGADVESSAHLTPAQARVVLDSLSRKVKERTV